MEFFYGVKCWGCLEDLSVEFGLMFSSGLLVCFFFILI